MTGLVLGLFMTAVNHTIVSTAMPEISNDLGSLGEYTWVFTAYLLPATVTVPIWGPLSDTYGRRPIYVTGLLLFIAGSALGGLADSMAQLIAARAVQGLGAGAVLPVVFASVADLVPASERGRWQGLIGTAFVTSSVIGPSAGAWIVENADWHWVFNASIPIALAALVMAGLTLRIPPHPERARRVDWAGGALLAAGLSAFLLGLIELGARQDGRTLVLVAVLVAGGGAVLALFAARQRHSSDPILPPELMRDPTFRTVGTITFLVAASSLGVIVVLPLYIHAVLGTSVGTAGLMLAPFMVSLGVATAVAGELIVRSGRYRWALVSGPLLMAIGFVMLAGLGVGSPLAAAVAALVVLGVGTGLVHQNVTLALQNAMPSRLLGTSTAALQFCRTTGHTVGITALGSLMAAGLPAGATALGADIDAAAAESAIHPLFVLLVPVLAVCVLVALRVPELPLERSVRGDIADVP